MMFSDLSQWRLSKARVAPRICAASLEPLALLRQMGFSIRFDTVKSGWSIVSIEGLRVIISETYNISFSED